MSAHAERLTSELIALLEGEYAEAISATEAAWSHVCHRERERAAAAERYREAYEQRDRYCTMLDNARKIAELVKP